MNKTRLDDYRKLRAQIAKNKGYLSAASKYLYSDPKFPLVIKELGEKTTGFEQYCSQHYEDVEEFIAAAALQDPNTGYVMKAYYHDAMSWEDLAAAGRIDPEQAKALARAYITAA